MARIKEELKKKSRKICAKIRIMRKLAKIGIAANFGTMPILALILALEQKLALVPILALGLIFALVWCKFWPCRKIGIGANFGTGANFGIGANFGTLPTSCEIPSLLLFDFFSFFFHFYPLYLMLLEGIMVFYPKKNSI